MKKIDSAEQRRVLVSTLRCAYMEIFPTRSVEESLGVLPPRSCISVTCSPSKGIDLTLDVVERLTRRGFTTVPHLAAKTIRDDAHLSEIIKRIDDLHINCLFVVGGDASEPVGPYSTALQVLQAISEKEHKFTQIGIAAHPEGHPCVDNEQLLQQMEEKQKFATYFVTQMCFDASVLGNWLRQIRARGIMLPAWIGLPCVANRTQLISNSLRIGVGDSLRFLSKRFDITKHLLKSKIYRPDALLLDLAPYLVDPHFNIEGLHIFSFNQITSSEKWRVDFVRSIMDESGKSICLN